jgi:hypothetical protein
MGPANQATIRLAAANGLVVNASTESRATAAALVRQGIAAVCVVPPDAPAVFRHEGVRFVACPASRSGRKVQCISCGGRFGLPLCAQADRGFVITFPPMAPVRRRQRPTAAEGGGIERLLDLHSTQQRSCSEVHLASMSWNRQGDRLGTQTGAAPDCMTVKIEYKSGASKKSEHSQP